MEQLFEAILDTLKLTPFLFVSFVIMELLEHKLTNQKKLNKISKFGPLAGATLGLVPQCGFSVLGAALYSGRIITLGTLFAIFLSTSDEMLPILIANNTSFTSILKILFYKFILGLFFGIVVDIIFQTKLNNDINKICDDDNCHCKDGIIKSSLIHTFKIISFIFIINLLLNFMIDKEVLSNFTNSNKILSPILSSIIGLIPNCASSVVITELYLENILPLGSCVSGLLTGSGLGLLVLFKKNKNLKENILILITLILFSSICGIIINIL